MLRSLNAPNFDAVTPAGIASMMPEKLRREPSSPTTPRDSANSSDANGSIRGIAAR